MKRPLAKTGRKPTPTSKAIPGASWTESRPENKAATVTRVEVPTRALVTETFDRETPGTGEAKRADGAIVRMRPPAEVPDEVVEAVRKRWLDAGAERVVLEPRPKAKTLPEEAAERATRRARSSAREIVLALVAEANSSNPDELAELAERIMSEEGI